ncbi:MAG: polyphosphate polymerase domain-containing protein [Planctomycetes bacterium]|nr:polyphosphate polymerase domain-containing protein [Planctomycetota bacterium]
MEEVSGECIQSPSLPEPALGAGPAYELKFLVEEELARAAQAWASGRLAPDPHGDPELDGAYHTTTLYLDTPTFDVFQRRPSFRRSKHRLRRYGTEANIYLERKIKNGDRVRKQRKAIPVEEVTLLANPMSLVTWPGHWFHRRLLDRGLHPAALIAYERTAYIGAAVEGPLRLTLDRRLRGALAGEWAVPATEGGLPLLTGRVILELKFRSALPVLFKELVQALRLSPCAVSKYRSCMSVWGTSPARGEVVDA